jgi:hypothetical protein
LGQRITSWITIELCYEKKGCSDEKRKKENTKWEILMQSYNVISHPKIVAAWVRVHGVWIFIRPPYVGSEFGRSKLLPLFLPHVDLSNLLPRHLEKLFCG